MASAGAHGDAIDPLAGVGSTTAVASGRLGSIVIPAHNEATVIRRCLDNLLTGLSPDEVDVVVVCNGCTDDTADRVREGAYPIKLIEIPVANKVEALRMGERAVHGLPRVFLDADVTVTGRTIRRMLEATSRGAVAARPEIEFDLDGCTRTVRRYYAGRRLLPAAMTDLYAAGVYALSATARSRFEEFPLVIADDLYAARIVGDDEIEIVEGEHALVHVPRTSGALFRTLQRIYWGNRQLESQFAGIVRPTTAATMGDLLRVFCKRGHRLDAATYAAFAVAARAALLLRRGPQSWGRDDTTR
jgi:glycosyltransferase involved in cell wall biosynthesis